MIALPAFRFDRDIYDSDFYQAGRTSKSSARMDGLGAPAWSSGPSPRATPGRCQMLSRVKHEHIPQVAIISPTDAQSFLEKNDKNRPIADGWVKELARRMKVGLWRKNGEAIKVSSDGTVLDGQHRLWACIESGVPFETFVIYGLDADVFDTIDQGRKRTAGDILGMAEVQNSNSVASAVRWVSAYRNKTGYSAVSLSSAEIRDWTVKNPLIAESVSQVLKARQILAPGIAGALHFLFWEVDPVEADQFFTDLASGAGLSQEDGVLKLRERLIKQKMDSKSKLRKEEVFALAIRAWNHRRSGRSTGTLKGMIRAKDGSTKMPEIE